MAYSCMIGLKSECDGCGECGSAVVMYDIYDTEIYAGEEYYDINGEIVAADNIDEWLSDFKKVGEVETDEDSIVDDIRCSAFV